MEVPPKDPKEPIVSNKNWLAISLYAAGITFSVIAVVFYCKQAISTDSKIVNNVAFITLAFAQLFHVFNMSSVHSKIFVNEITKNKFVWIALIICTLLIVVVYTIPQMRLVLGLTILPAKAWLVSILAALIPVVIVQLYKVIVESRK